MLPIPNHIIRFLQKQQEFLASLPTIPTIDHSILKTIQNSQIFVNQLNFPKNILKAQFEVLSSINISIVSLSQHFTQIFKIQKSLQPFFSLAKQVVEFNNLMVLLKSERLHFPYPYTLRTLICISKSEKTENDLRNDLIDRLKSGEILNVLNKSIFPRVNFESKSEIINLIDLIFNSLADPNNKHRLEILWLFPITEKIIQKFFYDNLLNLKSSLMIIHDRNDTILKDSINKNNSELIEKQKRINIALKNILDIQDSYNNLDLGTFLHIIELSIDEWPATKAFEIVSIMILSKFVNFRNDFIHGRIIEVKAKHLAISISFFIMILNILLIENEEKPILFELKDLNNNSEDEMM